MATAHDDLADAFVTASRALVGIAIRSVEAAEVPVTVPQHRVLVLLAAEGDLTVGDIASLLGVNQSNASRICDRLQNLRLVRRQRATEDGRVVRVSLTVTGKQIVDAVTRARRLEVEEVLAHLTLPDVRRLVAALEAFNDAAHERDDHHWRLAST